MPNHLGFNENDNTCPSSITLSASPITIDVFLYDIFNTVVEGFLLQDNYIAVKLNSTNPESISTSDLSPRISSNSGKLLYKFNSN